MDQRPIDVTGATPIDTATVASIDTIVAPVFDSGLAAMLATAGFGTEGWDGAAPSARKAPAADLHAVPGEPV